MSEMFEKIAAGLSEAIEDAKSENNKLKRRTVMVVPVKEYNADQIKKIRRTVGMTQLIFAQYMGVSLKTVEAWESGANHPSGASSRLLNMMEMNAAVVEQYPFVRTE